ncbi:MAG: dUTP diphosphatase [Deltaproteobacteria bacterium]|nr:dUTP diphosphatase [Deltaproteobacteria bacterium]RKX58457.1 MAG: dUTP diphosphatase [Thermodesulfobacteriota bacterium]MBW1946918.1 dUTP diphosphatase [Deltaproteobacteria bacterium]MBW1967037.1 dUTP diphosphatase [Deltaproteobacteria bacterium]MBW2098292.1 dUTP diphosphatase [Deltaproteobacteria bacterium]
MPVVVQIKRLSHAVDLPLPHYITRQSAGMDLAAAIQHDIHLHPGEIGLVPTGLAVALPHGYEFQIRPRSGLAIRSGLTVINAPGTIDADYRGEIKVGLINLGPETVTIKRKQRIAQMILARIWHASWQEVDSLPATARGEGGFGHSGV